MLKRIASTCLALSAALLPATKAMAIEPMVFGAALLPGNGLLVVATPPALVSSLLSLGGVKQTAIYLAPGATLPTTISLSCTYTVINYSSPVFQYSYYASGKGSDGLNYYLQIRTPVAGSPTVTQILLPNSTRALLPANLQGVLQTVELQLAVLLPALGANPTDLLGTAGLNGFGNIARVTNTPDSSPTLCSAGGNVTGPSVVQGGFAFVRPLL